jgi:GH24 family phage-related lysozyme (muramidase)
MGDTCTREQAEYYLTHEINLAKSRIVRFLEEIELELNPNQFGALVSFAYNLGAGVITNSDRSMSIALRAKDLDLVANTFLIYNKAGGKALTGLATRRNAERELFLKPV